MKVNSGQGAIELRLRATAGTLHGQGATEYLVLLAVVLIIALVGIALLGFFPGTANEAQLAESRLYWSSASPIAIVEIKIADSQVPTEYANAIMTSLKVRNAGAYPLRVRKVLGEGTEANSTSNGPSTIFTPIDLYLAPGEEKFLVYNAPPAFDMYIGLRSSDSVGYYYIKAAPACDVTASGVEGSTAIVKDFGFEYIQYVEGQQITKRQIGAKPLIVRCVGSYYF